MSKVKLSKAELAALDALIASFEDEESIKYSPEDPAFITAVIRVVTATTRLVVKATPTITDAGVAALDSTDLSKMTDASGQLSLDALIKLREEASN